MAAAAARARPARPTAAVQRGPVELPTPVLAALRGAAARALGAHRAAAEPRALAAHRAAVARLARVPVVPQVVVAPAECAMRGRMRQVEAMVVRSPVRT